MAGKLDPNKLVIGLKKEFKKEDSLINGNAMESAIKKIHADEKEKNKTGKRTKRITLDIEIPLHKMIAIHLLETDITFKEYFLGLAKKTLDILINYLQFYRQAVLQFNSLDKDFMNAAQAKKIPMFDLLASLGHNPVDTRKSGSEAWYRSPFRNETEPSFKIRIDQNIWYDFGEGEGGNIIDFVMKYNRVGFSDALSFLGSKTIKTYRYAADCYKYRNTE